MTTIDTDVLIVGAGSAGLVLAIELARRGITFRLIEKQDKSFEGSRGKGLQPRTLELFHDLGVLDAITAASGLYPPIRNYASDGSFVDVAEKPKATQPGEPYLNSLMIPQWRTEAILRDHLRSLGAKPSLGEELLGLVDRGGIIEASVLSAGRHETVICRYIVGTDGGRSTVRKALGIEFPGNTRSMRMLIADLPVEGLSHDAWHRWKHAPGGQFALCPLAGTSLFQMTAELEPGADPETSSSAIRRLIFERTGREDLIPGTPSWVSIYRVNFRLADRFRVGRAFIAGDAAHVHPPTGGQGLNTSVQDAYNLGWKLAGALGGAPDALLDTYQEERRDVAADVLGLSDKLLQAMADQGDMNRGRETFQLDLGYRKSRLSLELRQAPKKVRAGDRAPDARLATLHGGEVRLFDLFAHAGFSVIAYRSDADLSSLVESFGVRTIAVGIANGMHDTYGELAASYGLEESALLLVRPDGYIAVGATGDNTSALHEWLNQWIGPKAGVAAKKWGEPV